MHETVARARFAVQKSGALLENEVGKMCSRPSRELDLHFNEFALHFKIAKTEGSGHFWKMKQAKSARDSSQFKIAKT